MARFDVHKYNNPAVPLVVSVQADLLEGLHTRVVIPLVPEAKAKKEISPRLKPVIEIKGKNYVLMTTDIGTLPTTSLGATIANIETPHRQTITDAIDFMLQGF